MNLMERKEEDFRIYRRNLPHWRMRGALYFVTWRVHKKQPELTPEERELVVSALRHFDGRRYELVGFVVMDDHAHVLVWPEDGYALEESCRSWKSFTAHEMQRRFGRIGSVWQDESFDRIIRSEKELYGKMMYILNNHRKQWPEIKSYRWVWAKGM